MIVDVNGLRAHECACVLFDYSIGPDIVYSLVRKTSQVFLLKRF